MKAIKRLLFISLIMTTWMVALQCNKVKQPPEDRVAGSDLFAAPLLEETANNASSTASLKILAWNINGGNANITNVANYIKSVDADIIGLSEIYQSQIDPIMTTLGSGYQRTFHRTKTNAKFGTLTISRKPIEGAATQRWIYSVNSTGPCGSSGDNGNRQGLMKTKIDIGSGKYLFFYLTHFGRECDVAIQNQQIVECKTWSNTHGGRKIIVGDFNFQPSSTQHAALTSGGAGFFDPLGTQDADSLRTWKVGSNLKKRIDYIMGNGWVTFSSIATDFSAELSDHYPVIATVNVTL